MTTQSTHAFTVMHVTIRLFNFFVNDVYGLKKGNFLIINNRKCKRSSDHPDYLLTIQDFINHRAYPIDQIPARTRHAAAIIHMILNNLDPCVAQFPQELVTYGGNGQVFSNWAQVRYYAFWKRNKFKKRDFFFYCFICLIVCLFVFAVCNTSIWINSSETILLWYSLTNVCQPLTFLLSVSVDNEVLIRDDGGADPGDVLRSSSGTVP